MTQRGIAEAQGIAAEGSAILLQKPPSHIRAGWAEATKALAATGDDVLVWPEFACIDHDGWAW